MTSRRKSAIGDLELENTSSSDGRDIASNLSSPGHRVSPAGNHHNDADVDDDDDTMSSTNQQENNDLIVRRARKRRAQQLSQQQQIHQAPLKLRLMTSPRKGQPGHGCEPANGGLASDVSHESGRRTRHHSSSSTGSSTRATSPEDDRDNPLKGIVPPDMIICSWCQNVGSKKFTLQTNDAGGRSFCSELCFNQYRRASFKKTKLCDWCKGARGSLNLVDYLDGDAKLQFCSDACLNQYKMNIFCKETQAHLDLLHNFPELMEQHSVIANNNNSINGTPNSDSKITPDLWLLNGESENSQMTTEDVKQQQPSSQEVPTRSQGLRQKNLRGRSQMMSNRDVKQENGSVNRNGTHHAKQNGHSASAMKIQQQKQFRRASLSPSLASSPPPLLARVASPQTRGDLRDSGDRRGQVTGRTLQPNGVAGSGQQQGKPTTAQGLMYHQNDQQALQQLYATAMLQASQALSSARAVSNGPSLPAQSFLNFPPFIVNAPVAPIPRMDSAEGTLPAAMKLPSFQPLNLTKVLAPTACHMASVIPAASVNGGSLHRVNTDRNESESRVEGAVFPKMEPASPTESAGDDNGNGHGMATMDNQSLPEPGASSGAAIMENSRRDSIILNAQLSTPPTTSNGNVTTSPANSAGHGPAGVQPHPSTGSSSLVTDWFQTCISMVLQKFQPSLTATIPVPIIVPIPIPVPIIIRVRDNSTEEAEVGRNEDGNQDEKESKSEAILDLSSQRHSV